jgi:hypothetical protein
MADDLIARPMYLLEDDDVVTSWWLGAREPETAMRGRVRVLKRNRRGRPCAVRVTWDDRSEDDYTVDRAGSGGIFTTYRRRGEVLDWEQRLLDERPLEAPC